MTLTLLLLMIAGSLIGACQTSLRTDSIAESHIRANVPDEKDFDTLLKRDLEAYFRDFNGKVVTVQYELLRKGPTQTGIAFPKFYAWVKIYEKDNLLNEGAIRLAAIEKTRFKVTDYVRKGAMKVNPEKFMMSSPER